MSGNGNLDDKLAVAVCLNHKPVRIFAVFVMGEWRNPKGFSTLKMLLKGATTYQGLCDECAKKTS